MQCREQVASAERVVKDMSQGITPQCSGGLFTGFYRELLHHCAYFFVFGGTAASSKDTMFAGAKGVAAHIAMLQKRMEEKQNVAIGEIEQLRAFWLLLTAEQVKSMQAITRHAVGAAAANHRVRKRDDAAEARGSRTNTSKTEVFDPADSSTAAILKFFS